MGHHNASEYYSTSMEIMESHKIIFYLFSHAMLLFETLVFIIKIICILPNIWLWKFHAAPS